MLCFQTNTTAPDEERRLPVIVVISEETTSTHVDVLFLLFLFLLLLLLLLLLSSGRGSSSRGSSTNTRSSQHVHNVLISHVGSEHGRPVGSNGETSSLHDLVEVLLLAHQARSPTSYSNLHLGISTQQHGKRNSELFLLNSRHIFKRGHS